MVLVPHIEDDGVTLVAHLDFNIPVLLEIKGINKKITSAKNVMVDIHLRDQFIWSHSKAVPVPLSLMSFGNEVMAKTKAGTLLENSCTDKATLVGK